MSRKQPPIESILRAIGLVEDPDVPAPHEIVMNCFECPSGITLRVINRGIAQQLIWWDATRHGCGYRLTIQGRQLLDETRVGAPARPADERAWKVEALTGTRQSGAREGRQSDLGRAVLPTAEHKARWQEAPDIEELIDAIRSWRDE